MDDYADAIEVDFLSLGVDVLDLWRGALSVRRAWVLIEHFARDENSALVRAANLDNAGWSLGNHLLAGVYDALNTANWQRGASKDQPRPKRLPRPGVEDEDAARASVTEQRARDFLKRHQRDEAP